MAVEAGVGLASPEGPERGGLRSPGAVTGDSGGSITLGPGLSRVFARDIILIVVVVRLLNVTSLGDDIGLSEDFA
jgi:hypothetical protein